MGSLDWGAAAVSMWLAQISCVGAVAIWSKRGAIALSLPNLWATFVLLFVVQALCRTTTPTKHLTPIFTTTTTTVRNPTLPFALRLIVQCVSGLTSHYSLLTTHYSLLTAHYSLLTTH